MSHIHIDVTGLNFSYEKNQPVLNDISFHASEHDAIGLIGANGQGKSTLLKLLVGLDLNFTGDIRVQEIPLSAKTLGAVREKIGYVFQDSDSQLFMSTVHDDVAFGPRNMGLPEDEVDRRVDHALEVTRISHLKERPIYKLSGGEKKLASIATIISMTPNILLMDEPSVALDPRNRRNLISILNTFEHLKIIASHDLDMIRQTCNRVMLMYQGQIVADGEPETILNDAALLEKYGL